MRFLFLTAISFKIYTANRVLVDVKEGDLVVSMDESATYASGDLLSKTQKPQQLGIFVDTESI